MRCAMRKLLMGTALATFALTAPAFAGVVNGGFESGDTGFSSGYTSETAGVTNTSCYPAASYAVVNSPDMCHNLWSAFAPHSGKLQLVANGAGDATIDVWSETLTGLTPFTNYSFDAWAASSYPTSPADLSFKVNGGQIGTLLLSSTPGSWSQFSGIWNSGASTSATLAIFDLNIDGGGNDFTLDDISSSAATGVPEPMTLALFGGGLAGIGAMRRRRKAKS
jgi:PEP-CTERM motif